LGCDAVAIDHHRLIDEVAPQQLMAGRGQAGHAPLTQYAKGLQRQRRGLGDAGEQAPGRGLILDQLLQGLMRRQMLRPHVTTGQDDQVERLCQHVHQHRIGRHSGAARAGEHAPSLDAGHNHFNLGTA
jgi:hypothetical protein